MLKKIILTFSMLFLAGIAMTASASGNYYCCEDRRYPAHDVGWTNIHSVSSNPLTEPDAYNAWLTSIEQECRGTDGIGSVSESGCPWDVATGSVTIDNSHPSLCPIQANDSFSITRVFDTTGTDVSTGGTENVNDASVTTTNDTDKMNALLKQEIQILTQIIKLLQNKLTNT